MKVLLVVLAIALVVWVIVRLLETRIHRRSAPPPRVSGPDDDPDFLRGLDRRDNSPTDGPDE